MVWYRGNRKPDIVCWLPVLPCWYFNIYRRLYSGKKNSGDETLLYTIHLAPGTAADNGAIRFFYVGLAHTTGTKGSIINASNAFISIVAAHFMLKSEKMTWKKGIGCGLGLAGIVVINLVPGAWGTGFSLNGEGLIVLCSAVYGISTVLLKMISDKESPMTITAYEILLGSIFLIVIGLFLGGHVGSFTVKSTLLLMYLALLSAAAFSIWTVLLKYNPVGKVAVYGFTIPIFGTVFSAIILGEQILSLRSLSALLLVSTGIIMVNSRK